MVGLAKQFKDEAFHLIASYCQRGEKDAALRYLRSRGWSEEMENISVMFQTRYASELKINYVPYYLIFDHTGKLRYHHMAGRYHGGDGNRYQERVAELLKEVPKNEPAPDSPLSEMRKWMNAQGRIIEASLLGVCDDNAKFRMRNGRTYQYPLKKLSGESRKEIEELARDLVKE